MLKQQHHIVAPVSDELMDMAAIVVNKIRFDGPATKHVDELFELIMALTESGLNFYFLEPLLRIQAGSMVTKVANMGISSVRKGMKLVVHKALKKLSDEQLIALTTFVEEVLFEAEKLSQNDQAA